MFDSAVLEVTVGVLVVFLLVSTVCTAIREGIEARLKTRAAYLEAGIRELLQDTSGTGIAQAFFRHPVIFSLYSGDYTPGAAERSTLESGGNLPSYISGRSFAMALLDIVARGPTTDAASASPDLAPITLASLRRNVASVGNPHLQRMLLLAIDSAEGDIERARQNLHTWFDDSMGRVSGWYKRSTQKVLFFIAVVVVGALNINTLTIAQFLYRNDVARADLVAAAERAADDGSPTQDAALGELMKLELPIGWSQGYGAPEVKPWHRYDARGKELPCRIDFWNDIVGTVFGLLITVFAAMLGAPFWFDVLSRATAIRSTFKPKGISVAALAQASTASPSGSTSDPSPGTTQSTLTAIKVTSTHTSEPAAAGTATESDGDACDHPFTEETSDEDLPPARGGVAPK